jgi:predicted transport protein
MAIFEIDKGKAKGIRLIEFVLEKELQRLVEENLETIFNCRLIATEFSTGSIHSGRIDTLAISEDSNPVIIEYKKIASSDLINQSLYYLHWIKDHRGDFQIAANKVFNKETEVDWSDIRVICIAPEYKKYDIHAVQVMGANIELWQYKIYENGIFNIEEIYRRKITTIAESNDNFKEKNPVMIEAGRKAAITRKTAIHTIQQHLELVSPNVIELFEEIRKYILSIDDLVDESSKKRYIAYKTIQNFVCLKTYKNEIKLYLKLNPGEIKPFPLQGRDVSNTGRMIGDLEITITDKSDFEKTKYLIYEAFKNIGG